jgi:succinate dehydrogenase / fumarate reductase cytochrome b subunit
LVLALITHVYCAISITRQNRSARLNKYAVAAAGEKKVSKASRTMAVQGSLILVFIILHIATFKYGTYYETTVGGETIRDLHRLIVEVFHQPGYIFWYVICLVLLGFHLSHGVKSSFQSLGLMNGSYRQLFEKVSIAYAVIVAAGFIAQPIYVYLFN